MLLLSSTMFDILLVLIVLNILLLKLTMDLRQGTVSVNIKQQGKASERSSASFI